MPAIGAENDELVGGHGKRIADRLDRIDQLILNDERAGLAILHDVADLRTDQPEIDRHGDQARQRRRCINFKPFDAVIGEDADPIALGEAETHQRVGETARALMPRPEGHRPFKIARADLVGKCMSMHAEHDSHVRQLSHSTLLHDQSNNTLPAAGGSGNA